MKIRVAATTPVLDGGRARQHAAALHAQQPEKIEKGAGFFFATRRARSRQGSPSVLKRERAGAESVGFRIRQDVVAHYGEPTKRRVAHRSRRPAATRKRRPEGKRDRASRRASTGEKPERRRPLAVAPVALGSFGRPLGRDRLRRRARLFRAHLAAYRRSHRRRTED